MVFIGNTFTLKANPCLFNHFVDASKLQRQVLKANVSEHITNIFKEGELVKEAVVRKFRTTASDGKNYNVLHYNLDMIIR